MNNWIEFLEKDPDRDVLKENARKLQNIIALKESETLNFKKISDYKALGIWNRKVSY